MKWVYSVVLIITIMTILSYIEQLGWRGSMQKDIVIIHGGVQP